MGGEIAKTSPTQRSLALLRGEGYLAAVVEHWNSHARIRQDLFGLFDLLGIRSDTWGVLAVQTTSANNMAARAAKLLDSDALYVWLASGNRAEVHGWALRGPAGSRKVWTCNRRVLTLAESARWVPTDAVPHPG